MDNSIKQNILERLKEIDTSLVVNSIDWPKAYCHDYNSIKAIVLGCDPSNRYSNNMEYVFAIGTETPLLKQFFSGIKNNLQEVGISLDEVYVQNLCQNYFTEDTSNNSSWKEMAKVWIPFLKNELDNLQISKEVPVLLTAGDLYEVLIKKGVEKYTPKCLYSNLELTPIKEEDNYLNRPMFPFYRGGHGFYNLKKWPKYVEHLREYLKQKLKSENGK